MQRRNRITIAGSTALVTGASGGLGHAIARMLSARGARLVLSGRRTEVLAALADELGARVVACDLASRQEVARMATELASTVDVFVANAGLPATGKLEALTQAEIDQLLEVNLRAPIALARAFAPAMIERRRGHMVFISSLSGKAVQPASSMYSATKFGLRGFALALRTDLRRHGVGVSVVVPGFVRDAGMFANSGMRLPPGIGTSSPDEVATAVIRAITSNRAELGVAPLHIRVGASIASVAPGLAEGFSRRFDADRIATGLAAAHRDKR
ncbi:MAG: SDR family NAD(P)-dependent oxidoreductase [Solirubrobacteraceae bacterium]